MPTAHRSALPGYGRFFDAPNRIVQMIFAGIFDRFPELALVVAEVDCGWVPYFKEQIDNNYERLRATSDFTITDLPSTYVEQPRPLHLHHRHRRRSGIATRSASSGSCGRATTRTSAPTGRTRGARSRRASRACPPRRRALILAGNAVRLYGFGE